MNNLKDLREHTISIMAYKNPGVILKITSLITRRRFVIKSISVGDSKEKNMYRLTVVIDGDKKRVEQMQKQVNKIIDTVKVSPVHEVNKVEREIGLIKIKTIPKNNSEIINLVNVYNGRIIDSSPEGMIIEMVGSKKRIDGFLSFLPRNNIIDIARTGTIAMDQMDFLEN